MILTCICGEGGGDRTLEFRIQLTINIVLYAFVNYVSRLMKLEQS